MLSDQIVLIVDDDLTNRLVLRALINEAGFSTLEAENGEQAVEMVETHHVDIILLDIMMPVMNGYQSAKIIKSRLKRFIPIIFLTALTDEEALAQCIEAGGDDFLTKPYNHILLTSKINSMLRIAALYARVEDSNRKIRESNIKLQQERLVTKKLFDKITRDDMRGENTGLKYSMSPMSMFNGDIILAERNQTNGLDILVGDFTGHGLSAAVGAIPVSEVFHTMSQKCFGFAETLAEINFKLIDLLPTQMFMAAALITVDRSNNVLSIVNCGLPDIYLYRNNEIVNVFKSRNLPLGIYALSAPRFEVEIELLQYGDRLFIATDGIMEATNSQGQMYGVERLKEVFEHNNEPEKLFGSILSSVDRFCEGAAQSDDITLLELCHLETVEYAQDEPRPGETLRPSEWTMKFSLDIAGLRQFDVLPFIMQGIDQLQPLECGRTSMHTVLTEMFTNALDHGVLKLDSSMKETPHGYMEYYREKQRRIEQLEQGTLEITLRHEIHEQGGGRLSIHIVDSGDGYDFASTIGQGKNIYSGRGLKLISSLCTEMQVQGNGNSVLAYYDWHPDEPAQQD